MNNSLAREENSQGSQDAWEKVHQVMQAWRRTRLANLTHLPWQEISYKLRCNGDFVDLTAMPPYWLSERVFSYLLLDHAVSHPWDEIPF